MVDISIIVAAYQAEKYICRSLDSIKNQTFKNYEVILVDDGSFDKTGKICDEYAVDDSRFRVIHKKNGGVSSARQAGIDSALGEFVIHVDPDDWIEPAMLEEMYECAKNTEADVVISDFFVETRKKRMYVKQKPTSLDYKSYFYDLIDKLHGCCWNKLIRRECFCKYDVKFPQNIVMCEDSYVNLKLALNPIKLAYLPKAFYHYDRIVNGASAVFTVSGKKLMSQVFIIDWLQKQIGDSSFLIERKKQAKYTALNLESISASEFKELYSEINYLFKLELKSIGRLDFFVFIALHFSLSLARFMYRCKVLFFKL